MLIVTKGGKGKSAAAGYGPKGRSLPHRIEKARSRRSTSKYITIDRCWIDIHSVRGSGRVSVNYWLRWDSGGFAKGRETTSI